MRFQNSPELELEFELGDTELQLLEFKSAFIRLVESQFGAIKFETKPPKPCVVGFTGKPLFEHRLDIGVLALQLVLLKLFSEFEFNNSICSKSFLHNKVSSLRIVKCSPCTSCLEHESHRKQLT